ncbi:MAG: hypothetical protein FJ095_20700 [Deltaproteobacteria bacterium]|nr:hypothetical protein [Deltaproteobacteria bacterium]
MEYSAAMRRRMVQRMTGPRAIRANARPGEVGVGQATLSWWLREARIFGGVVHTKSEPLKPVSACCGNRRIVNVCARRPSVIAGIGRS